MRAIQITNLNGPDEALELVDIPEPEPSHMLTPGSGVLVDVQAAGVSFPEVLQSRGEYQFKPDLPFVPGSEVGGVVRSAPDGAAVKAGDRVAAFCFLGAHDLPGARHQGLQVKPTPVVRSPALGGLLRGQRSHDLPQGPHVGSGEILPKDGLPCPVFLIRVDSRTHVGIAHQNAALSRTP